jgi:hypothetical protein
MRLAFLVGALLSIGGILQAACGSASQSDANAFPTITTLAACYASEPDCQTRSASYEPTPEPPDYDALRVALADPAIGEMIGTRRPGVDYWLNFTASPLNQRNEQITAIVIVFATPRPWSGVIPQWSNPCRGGGAEGRTDPEDPCLAQPRSYSARAAKVEDLSIVHMFVDLERQAVVHVDFSNGAGDLIAYLSKHYRGQY